MTTDPYTRIMSLPDTYGIKPIIRHWKTLSENLERMPNGMPVLLPDLLLVAEYGVGRTHVLDLISDFLTVQSNLMDFYGDVKYFEFFLRYCPPDQKFTEFSQLIGAVSDAAGFRSEYRGIISIDINEWLGHCEEKHFLDLLEYLADHSDHWLIIFTVPNADEKKLNTLEGILSMFLRIEKAELKYPASNVLFQYVNDILAQYGIVLENNAKTLLTASIEKLRDSKYFDGYKTLDILSLDIIYKIYSSKTYRKHVVTTEELMAFAEDGYYIRTRIQSNQKKNSYTIGFTGGSAE